jgi:hypothetical protein
MKDLYIITIELDEDSIYFTSMTPAQAKEMRKALGKMHHAWTLYKIKSAPGFNSYADLLETVRDMAL